MKRSLLFLALISIFASANATQPSSSPSNNTANATSNVTTQNNVTGGQATIQKGAVEVNSKQQQFQGQAQEQVLENVGNTSSSIGAGANANNVKINTEQAASMAYAPANNPTASCMGSSSVGASGVAVGLTFGTSWTSEECLILETARSFDQAKDKFSALEVRCQAKYAKTTTACKDLAKQNSENK